jgi:hypothetical protein
MAFTDLFSNMNIFGARAPEYLVGSEQTTGLLDEAAKEKLKNQALIQGLLGAGATYLSMPKNQGYGSALPYLGKAYLGGMQASQGAYDVAGKNYLDQQNQANINTLLKDPRIANDSVLKALVSSGKIKEASDVLNPQVANEADRYASAYYNGKTFKELEPKAQQEVLAKIESSKTNVARASAPSQQPSFKDAGALRQEYTGLPDIKAYNEVNTAYNQIKTALSNPSPANDLAAATKFMKLLDPNSVVRESELMMAMQASGVTDRIANLGHRIMSGEKLTEAQRKDFYDAATEFYKVSQNNKNAIDAQYIDIAQKGGLSPDLIIRKVKKYNPATGKIE